MLLAPTLSLSAGSGAAIARPTFSRDFAGEKTLNNGTGPAITFTRASNATFFDANGTLQTASNDTPRFDHDPATGASRGLLIEESRTNSIRNAQAGGAVAGTPGTMPTNWSAPTSQHGLTREIVGTGTTNGLSWIDIRYSGTTNTNSGLQFQTESATQIPATAGDTWTGSAYVELVGGSSSGISWAIQNWYHDSAGVFINFNDTAFTPTSSRVRVSHTGGVAANATRIRSVLQFFYASGVVVDFTLRIAAPQLEQGAFATSYIPTTTAAATRAADSAVVTPIASFYNQAEGTLFAEGSSFSNALNCTLAAFSQGAEAGERVQLRARGAGAALSVVVGGVAVSIMGGTDPAANVTTRRSAATKLNDFAVSIDGAAPETDTLGTMPAVTHLAVGALTTVLAQPLNGHIRKIAYYPRRLSNTLLQQLTT